MTDANPAFDTVHPSGHILVRSCRGGYMHSVALSEEAMETDTETLAQGILLTADVSCLESIAGNSRRNRGGRAHPIRGSSDPSRS